ncbi:hypothetical protein [Nocardia salmonicida]|nr:hypothetical protein [Nocardia salmonicida]
MDGISAPVEHHESGTAPADEAKRGCVRHALYDTAADAILRIELFV